MRLNLRIFLVFACMTWTSTGLAGTGSESRAKGLYFEETFFPVYVSRNDTESPAGGSATSAVTTETGWGIDSRTTLGYVFHRFLIGATYNTYSVTSSRPGTPDYESLRESSNKEEVGATLGYLFNRVRLTTTYIFSAKKKIEQEYADGSTGVIRTDESRLNTHGSGFQIGLGYDFQLGAKFGISPTLIFKTVTYNKQRYDVSTGTGTPYPTTDLQTKAIDSELRPMITLNVVL